MFIELCLNRDFKTDDILKSKFYHKIDNIALHSSQIGSFPDKNKSTSVLIDYPYGLNNTSIREHEILYSIRAGASKIDLTLNSAMIAQNNVSEILKDLRVCYQICKDKKVDLRTIIEYRLVTAFDVMELCYKIRELGVRGVIIGSGTIVDDINDNIILSAHIAKGVDLEVTSCTNFCDPKFLPIYNKANVAALRLMSLAAVNNLLK